MRWWEHRRVLRSPVDGSQHTWVVALRPRDVTFDANVPRYARNSTELANYARRPYVKRRIAARARSTALARRLGLYEAARDFYEALGWARSSVQLHHLDGAGAPGDGPSRWVFVPRCIHQQLFHGRTCRVSHPHHSHHGAVVSRVEGRRRASERWERL